MDHLLTRPVQSSRAGLLSRLQTQLAFGRHRRRLRELSDHILDDIGITRDEAEREASRPVWDVPRNWRR